MPNAPVTQFISLNPPSAQQVEQVFDQCFLIDFNTRLRGGLDEPIYLPSTSNQHPHTIWFRHDYVASALHEVAHWCLAGAERRLLEDFGYWYAPDGRSAEQQAEFERLEVKPQALEWIFSCAAGLPFRVSADNLNAGLGASAQFKARVAQQAQYYCEHLPERPRRFVQCLSEHCATCSILDPQNYCEEALL